MLTSIIILIGLDGRSVIIFGGFTITSEYTDYISSGDALYVLNLANFNWFIPKTSGQAPIGRFSHKANVIGKYMVISFGKYNYTKILIY